MKSINGNMNIRVDEINEQNKCLKDLCVIYPLFTQLAE